MLNWEKDKLCWGTMKTNNWHYTDKGPQKCKRSLRHCLDEKHFGSWDIAFNYGEKLKKQAIWDEKIAGLQKKLENPGENRLFVSVLSGSRNGGARKFGDKMDSLFHGSGITPTLFYGHWQASVHNGSYKPVEITVNRTDIVDTERGMMTGTWEAVVKTTKSESFGFAQVNEKTKLDLSNPEVSELEFVRLREIFRDALDLSGVHVFTDNRHLMEPKIDELMDSFLGMFNAVESESMGEPALADLGLGYFRDSAFEEIRANEEYAFSAFRGINFERYLTQNTHFETTVPRLNLRITDYHQYSDAYWSLYCYGGQWGVQFTKHDGDTGEYPVTTAQDAFDAVYYHVLYSEGQPGDETVARHKATFAYEFVWDVNKAMAEHKPKAEAAAEAAGYMKDGVRVWK